MTLGSGLRDVIENERRFAPDDLYTIGSMLSYEERLLLHWAARTAPPGAIVDLGAFLGGSSLALASGVECHEGSVYSFDRFALDANWEREWLPAGTQISLGDSTLPVFDRNVARVRDRIVVRRGDVEDHGWDGRPIAVLFVDVTKSWSTADFVWSTFLPALRPGSLVIQQDLVHWGHPWCAIAMEHLSRHFEYLGWVWTASAVYRCVSPVSNVPKRLSDSLSCDEMVALIDLAAKRVGEPAAGSIRLSAAFVFGAFGRFDDAHARVADVRARYDDTVLPYIAEGFAYLDRWLADVRMGRPTDADQRGRCL